MYGWNNPDFIWPLIISNGAILLILFLCWKYQRIARLLMFLLFLWAGCINWYTALHNPFDYLDYANYALLPFYQSFIRGWFSDHILVTVSLIATGQLFIAFSMLFKGWTLKLGSLGGIAFMVAILPLGVGAGFPFPILGAVAFVILYKQKGVDYIWRSHRWEAMGGMVD